MGSSLPTPPREDLGKSHGPRKPTMGSKSMKTVHRNTKRRSGSVHAHAHPTSASATSVSASGHDGQSAHASADGRHKRVWKACERCRMKKTKCDGEFPCKRCKDDGLVCTAGVRKKTEYKQIPRGYAEVLENTQFALVATVHKLYSMVRNSQSWDLGEPELNDRGQPVIHNIASKLGCIRPNSDIDLPVQSAFPEDEAGLADLIARLEAQQQQELGRVSTDRPDLTDRADRASSSDLDTSDLEHDYRRMAFGGDNTTTGTLSPQSLTYHDFDARPGSSGGFSSYSPAAGPGTTYVAAWAGRRSATSMGVSAGTGVGTATSPTEPNHAAAVVPPTGARCPSAMAFGTPHFLQQTGHFLDADMLSQGLLESEFGTLKPHVLSCPNPEVMMGMGDPMIFSGYDPDSLRL